MQPRPAQRAEGARPAANSFEHALSDLEPRKLPRQSRGQATFEAIVNACAQVLAKGGYDALTTNAISERAGVSIGTLYEYFPNRESIVAVLATRSCASLVSRMQKAASESAALPDLPAIEHLLRAGIDALGDPESPLTILLRETPFVHRLPVLKQARATLDGLCRMIGESAGGRVNLPDPEVDAWLVSQMLFNAMLEIAGLDGSDRDARIRELARLTFRMTVGRDVVASDICGRSYDAA